MITLNSAALWLTKWNDKRNVPTDIRMLKLMEEVGEVANAYLGHFGTNPRKGVTHTIEELWSELADVMLAGAVAIRSLGGDPEEELRKRYLFVITRLEEMDDQ